MSLFSNFKVDNKGVQAPDWFRSITNAFGSMDAEERGRDLGLALSDKDKVVASSGENGDLIGAQFYGNIRRYVNFEEPTKKSKLNVYRQMAEYAEVKYAISMICDEIMNYSDLDGSVGRLIIENQDILKNINKVDNIKKEWKYVFEDLLKFRDTGRDAILSFLVSGELIYEKIINPSKKHEGLKRVKRLRPDNIYPIWEDDMDGISHFKVKGMERGGVYGLTDTIPRSQLAYVNWDSYHEHPETGDIYVVSYLEPVKKVWRQLQLLEEAVVIYRIVRAPERRIFKIATGNMPKAQAEQYVQKLMRTYRQKKIYNTSTGEIDGQSNILSMLEDYWFAQPENGNASEIDTLPAGESLGEITDLNYFLEKLYRVLEIPANRRLDVSSGDQKYNTGSITDISWQEVKFTKMVHRVRRKVLSVVWDVFKTHLKLKGLWSQYNLKDEDLRIEMHKNNFFEEMKRAQVEETRMNSWGTVSTYVGEVFSKEMAVKHFLKWTDEEWNENKRMLEKEKLEGDDEVEGGGGL